MTKGATIIFSICFLALMSFTNVQAAPDLDLSVAGGVATVVSDDLQVDLNDYSEYVSAGLGVWVDRSYVFNVNAGLTNFEKKVYTVGADVTRHWISGGRVSPFVGLGYEYQNHGRVVDGWKHAAVLNGGFGFAPFNETRMFVRADLKTVFDEDSTGKSLDVFTLGLQLGISR